MSDRDDNVILFPKLQTTLEQESLSALTNKNYREALDKLDQLLEHGVDHHEIMMGKLICLMELDQFEEAEELSEKLMSRHDTYYFEYVHIYLTMLFQTGQYELVIETSNAVLDHQETIPDPFREQFSQLRDLSTHMREEVIAEESAKLTRILFKAHANQDHHLQWITVEKLRSLGAIPKQSMESYLTDHNVHPMVKTGLFLWYQEQSVNRPLEIHKLGVSGWRNPVDTYDLSNSATIKQTKLLINEIEQHNPTLYKQLDQLLTRFTYVRYPLIPEPDQAPLIAEALKHIGHGIASIHNKGMASSTILAYAEEINLCDGLYLSMMDA
ncbi:TPR repeat-containing protein YsoA [Lentibacillus sp. JNUCC-1]|uniref:tetratricopeptide repeat protein n=1 Tax=Lentibacillus sp. JNUCC-1 TaxID=2654513 RepID=UPI0012E77AF7|nr:tetratricopeptide repeat protein [Lentibacillus sp. JNUCC-1]MUV39406.1 TPR repeat-containing protein YsoA [Lentibacillus sp. JNUCC-1]